MADPDPPDELAAAHPALRTVGPPEAPYRGVLRRVGAATRLFVDVSDYPAASWRCDPAGHVLAPLDVARRRRGHDVVLEHCVERIDDLLHRRTAMAPLADGEVVTLAVSLRRGLAELLATGGDVPARWWLTEDGRPVLACTADGDVATAATAAILSAVGARSAPRVADALGPLLEATGHPRALARDADLLESALFATATPCPISHGTAPRRSSLAGLVPDHGRSPLPPDDRWEELLHGHLDGELADLATAALRSVRRRLGRSGRPPRSTAEGCDGGDRAAPAPRGSRPERSGRPRRRARPWLVAGSLGAAVVGVGLLWPSPAGSDAAGAVVVTATGSEATGDVADAEARTPAGSATTGGAEDAGSTGPSTAIATDAADPGDPGDPVAAAAEILAAASDCDGDAACAAPLVEDPAGPTAARFLALAATAGGAAPELVDSFGGAAVVRVAHDGTSSLVVVVQAATTEGGWLVRDVYDVADQP